MHELTHLWPQVSLSCGFCGIELASEQLLKYLYTYLWPQAFPCCDICGGFSFSPRICPESLQNPKKTIPTNTNTFVASGVSLLRFLRQRARQAQQKHAKKQAKAAALSRTATPLPGQ